MTADPSFLKPMADHLAALLLISLPSFIIRPMGTPLLVL